MGVLNDPLNFLFLNIWLFTVFEAVIWVVFILILSLVFCVARKCFRCVKKRKNDAARNRFMSSARQYHNDGSLDPNTESQDHDIFGSESSISSTRPLAKEKQKTRPNSDHSKQTEEHTSSRVLTFDKCTCFGFCTKRDFLTFVVISFVSYFLVVITFVVFATVTETTMIIDPHACANETNTVPAIENATYKYWTTFPSYCNYTLDTPHEDFYIRGNDDGKIHAWWVNATESNGSSYKNASRATKTIILNHGRSLPMPTYRDTIARLAQMGHNVLAWEYPGFGRSAGIPTEDLIYDDGDVIMEEAMRRAGENDASMIAVMGISLGGGVTVEMAKRHNSKAVILISSVDSVAKDVDEYLKLTGWAVNLAIRFKFDAFHKINDLHNCLFFYVAGKDVIIPAWRGNLLWAQAKNVNRNCTVFFEDPNLGHMGAPLDNQKFMKSFQDWFKMVLW